MKATGRLTLRRLILRRETLRRLTSEEASLIAGGTVTLPICPSMWTCLLGGCPTITVCPTPVPVPKPQEGGPRDLQTTIA